MSQALRFLPRIVLIVITLTSATLAQKPSQSTTPPPMPDFSHAVDLTNGTHVQYQGYDKRPLTFSKKAQYVMVPVVVTDHDGKPVAGLRKEDFQLQENGKNQVISSVDEMIPIVAPVSKTAAAAQNEATNQLAIEDHAPRRLIIIALDMVNTPFLDQVRARQQVVTYLSEMLEADSLYQIVLIQDDGLRVLHDYTQNSAELIATLKSVRSHFPKRDIVDSGALTDFAAKNQAGGGPMGVTPGATSVGPSGNQYVVDPRVSFEAFAAAQDAAAERRYAHFVTADAARSTLLAFQQITQRVSGVPGRKSLIWITGGFPFSLDPATAMISEGVSFEAYQHVMQELSDQMIALYPVDARGLLTSNIDATMHLTTAQIAFPAAMQSDASNRQRDILETMRAFADMTGGRAYINTNDTTGAVQSASQDGAHYYLLTYPVDKSNRHAGWRKISVKVANHHVRARKGYYLTQSTVDPLASAKSDVDTALISPFDFTGLPLRIIVKPAEPAGDKRKVTFSIVMLPNTIRLDPEDGNHVLLDIAYVVLTPTGSNASTKGVRYPTNLNAEQLQKFHEQGLSFGDAVELAPGSYKLRVVVRDDLSGRIGSVQTNLRVD